MEGMAGVKRLKFPLQGMIGHSCIQLIQLYFRSIEGIELEKVELGKVSLHYNPGVCKPRDIESHFTHLGFTVIKNKHDLLFEQLLTTVINFVNDGNYLDCKYKNSDYLSQKLAVPYGKLSKIFSARTGITIERFLIMLKLEKVKQEILEGKYTLSEIAERLNYSSVHYLSNQFKRHTGISPREFKGNPKKYGGESPLLITKFHTKK